MNKDTDNDCPGCIIADDVVSRHNFASITWHPATELVRDGHGIEIDVCKVHAPLYIRRAGRNDG